MKRIYLLVVLSWLCFISATAQHFNSTNDSLKFLTILKEFSNRDTIKTRLVYDAKIDKWTYETRDISINTFDSLFKPIYAKVMLGNNDLVNQGSAYALTVNQFETKFNINYNWAHNKKKLGGVYYNAGFAASSSSKTLPLFSKDQWQQGFAINIGVTKSFNKSIFYTRGDDFDVQRNRAIALSLKETYNSLIIDTVSYLSNKHYLDSINEEVRKDPKLFLGSLSIVTYKGKKEFLNGENDYNRLAYLRQMDTPSIRKYVDSCLAAFETSYFKKYYYSFWWFSGSLAPEYKAISIYDTTAARIAGIVKNNYFRLGMNLNLNYAKSSERSLFLFQFGVGLKNTNYLEGRKPSNIEFLQSSFGDTIVNNLKDALVISDYDKYKKSFLLVSPSIGFNWFWGKKRLFGWESFFTAKLAAIKASEIPYDNLFTFRMGPLLSLNGKDDLAKSTFGLIAQWEDVKFSKTASIKDGFTFSVRIGIPFNF